MIKNETLRISTIIVLEKYGELTSKLARDLVQLKRKNEIPLGIKVDSIPSDAAKAAVRQAERSFCERWNYIGASPE